MKKNLFFILLTFAVSTLAQQNANIIKIGMFDPQATSTGFIIGYEKLYPIDEHLETGWSIDWFHKNYVDQKYVAEINREYQGNINSQLNELRATTNLHEIPVLFNVNYIHPVRENISAYLEGSLGGELMFIFYRNFINPDNDELKATIDFSWRITAGASLAIGSRSSLIGEVSYHSSKPSWTYKVKDPTTGAEKTFERSFDMSGILIRLGVKFYY
jgi:hypothetical protein